MEPDIAFTIVAELALGGIAAVVSLGLLIAFEVIEHRH